MRAFLLLLAAAAAAAAADNPAPKATTPLATMQIRVIGTAVNDTRAFATLVDDALALAVGWLSIEDLRRAQVVDIVPCNFPVPADALPQQSGKTAKDKRPAASPPPPPRQARRLLQDMPPMPQPSLAAVNGCRMLTLDYTVSPTLMPSASEFAELPDAIHLGTVATEMARLGVPVDGIDLLQLRVNDTMLSAHGIDSQNPRSATGNNAARFRLRLIGPDATFGMQQMLRELLLAVAHNLTTTSTDYVSVANARIVKVSHVDDQAAAGRPDDMTAPLPTAPPGPLPALNTAPAPADAVVDAVDVAAGATAPSPPPPSRRALAQVAQAAPATPPPPSRQRVPAVEPFNLGSLNADPALDVVMEISHLPPKGVRTVFDDVHLLSDNGWFTRTLQQSGYRIDSAKLAPTFDSFTVNGHPFDGGDTLMDRAILGDVAPLALTIAIPLLAVLAGLITAAVFWHKRQAKRGRKFFGGTNRVQSLAAAVAAARKGDTAGAAAMLLGDPAKKGSTPGGFADRLANDWQLDPASIEIQKDADGNQVVLGAGAAGTVYRGLLNGVQDVAIKVFKEPLAALASTGLTSWSSVGTPTSTAVASAANGGSTAATPKPRGLLPWRWSAPGTTPKSDDTAGGRGAALKPSPSTVDGAAAADAAVGSNAPAPNSAAAARQLEELAREVVLMRACRDRNLVSFVGACVAPGTGHPIIVSELLPNGDLYTALGGDDARRFGWTRARGPNGRPLPNTGLSRRIALDVARGLAYLHSRGVVHLDLKSPNILLSRAWEAKIADYGVSRVLRDRFVSTLPTAAGTLCWAAPEVLLGRPVNEKADIYSFGVVLWELSACEPPRGRCQRPLEDDEAPPAVAETIARCTSENPDDRPSAAELVKFFKSLDEDGHAPGEAGAATGATGNVAKVMRVLSSSKGWPRRAMEAAADRRPVGVEAAAVDVEAGEGATAGAAPELEPSGPAPAVDAPARRPPVVPAGGFAAAAAAADPAPPPPPAVHGRATQPPPRGPEV